MKLSEVLKPKSKSLFDYEKVVGTDLAMVSKFTLNREKELLIIYVENPIFKFELNQMIPRIKLELSKVYPDLKIKKAQVLIDKSGSIKAKNDFIIQANRKYVEKQNFYKSITKEEQKKYDEIDELFTDSEHLKNVAYMYFKTRDKEDNKMCSNCHLMVDSLVDGICLNCLYQRNLKDINRAKKEISKNPLIVNNSSIYSQAREMLVEEKYDNIFRYLEENKEINEEYFDNLIIELSQIFTASDDEHIVRECAIDIKEKVIRGYGKLRKNT